MGKLWDDDTNDFLRTHTRVAQSLRHVIRCEMVRLRKSLYALALSRTNAGRILQCTRHRCNGNTQLPRNVLHRNRCCFFLHFLVSVVRP